MLKAVLSKIEIRGRENLDKIPPNAKVVIATTHISDIDVAIPIAKLGRIFRIKWANASMQHHITQDPFINLVLTAAGIANAIPVDYHWAQQDGVGKSYTASNFNLKNFLPMRKALENGDTIVFAAHNPTHIRDGKLPLDGGHGAVYLAEISGATILPVAINIKSDDPLLGTTKYPLLGMFKERTEAEMVIGEPYAPERIDGIEGFANAQKKTYKDLRIVVSGLRRESERLMRTLAQLLPEERRGPWHEKLSEKQN
jgi:hypothetical protein